MPGLLAVARVPHEDFGHISLGDIWLQNQQFANLCRAFPVQGIAIATSIDEEVKGHQRYNRNNYNLHNALPCFRA
jgi:hypothetical protein